MAARGPEETSFLLLFDFDQTITLGHFHSFLTKKGISAGAATPELVALCIKELGLKKPDLMLQTMRTALKNGHKIGIVSYTAYPEVIPHTLKALGLTDEEVAQIKVVGGFPTIDGTLDLTARRSIHDAHGKELHIQKVREMFATEGVNVANLHAVLADDTKNNIYVANERGHIAIRVPQNDSENGQYGHYLELLNLYSGQYNADQIKMIAYNSAIRRLIINEIKPVEAGKTDYFQSSGTSGWSTFMQEPIRSVDHQKLERLQNFCKACEREMIEHPTQPINLQKILESQLTPELVDDLMGIMEKISQMEEPTTSATRSFLQSLVQPSNQVQELEIFGAVPYDKRFPLLQEYAESHPDVESIKASGTAVWLVRQTLKQGYLSIDAIQWNKTTNSWETNSQPLASTAKGWVDANNITEGKPFENLPEFINSVEFTFGDKVIKLDTKGQINPKPEEKPKPPSAGSSSVEASPSSPRHRR